MEAVGHTVHVVCPEKKAGDKIQASLNDFEGHQTYSERFGHFADINKTLSEAEKQLGQYDAVYCAGGRGPEYIRTDRRVQAMVRHFHETQKPIFTICHGVQILVAVDGLVRGKKDVALGACEPEVILAGGTFIDVKPTEADVDGAMVSAKGYRACRLHARMSEGAGHQDHPHLTPDVQGRGPSPRPPNGRLSEDRRGRSGGLRKGPSVPCPTHRLRQAPSCRVRSGCPRTGSPRTPPGQGHEAGSPQRPRQPVSVDQIHRATGRSGHRTFGRKCGRQL